jgi:hypothetical protein
VKKFSLEVGVPPPTSNKSVVGEGTPTTREKFRNIIRLCPQVSVIFADIF